MLNQTILVGRLTSDPKIIEDKNDRKVAIINLAISRSYKNENGEYETDFVDVTLHNGVAEQTTEFCKKGDIVGVKGRIQNLAYTAQLIIIAEKVTFLSSKAKDIENEERNEEE